MRAETSDNRAAAWLAGRERHLSDLVRVALGSAILAIAALPVRPDSISRAEQGAFALVNGLWDLIRPVVWLVMQLGAIAAVPVVVVAAIALRRRAMALDVGISGFVAWLLAKVVKEAFGRPRPGGLLDDVVFRVTEPTGMGFASGHTAVAFAMATAAAPYVPRRFRWLLGTVALVVGLSRIYVGAHLPLDVVGGAGLGWAVGAAWRFAVGAPSTKPSTDRVEAGLRKLGLSVAGVEPLELPSRVSAPFRLRTEDGRDLFAKVVVEEIIDRDVLVRLWRTTVHRGAKDEQRFRSPRAQVDHEAAVSLAAERAGVRTPSLAFSRELDSGAGVVAFEHLDAPDLSELADLDDAFLRDLFTQVRSLHDAGIAHGALVRENVLRADGQAWLVDFGFGQLAASEELRDQDLHELVISLAACTPPARVVAAARGVFGDEPVQRALDRDVPWSPATRTDLERDGDLRERVLAANGGRRAGSP